MSRKFCPSFIIAINPQIEACQKEFKAFVANFPPEKVASEILINSENKQKSQLEIAINVIKGNLMNNDSLRLLMRKLFNRHGKKSNIASEMIELFVDAVVFDLFMYCKKELGKNDANSRDRFSNIMYMFNKLSESKLSGRARITNKLDGAAPYLTALFSNNSHTKIYDRGKHVFHIYLAHLCPALHKCRDDINIRHSNKISHGYIRDFIMQHYNKNQDEAEFVILKCTAMFLNRLHRSSFKLIEKLECIYSLKTYEQNLYNVVFSEILPNPFTDLITTIEQLYTNNNDSLPNVLNATRRNSLNRNKSFHNSDMVENILKLFHIGRDIPSIRSYLKEPIHNFLCEILDSIPEKSERKAADLKRATKKMDITIGEVVETYVNAEQDRMPRKCLSDFDDLLKEFTILSRYISRYVPGKSNLYTIYKQCLVVCWKSDDLLHTLDITSREAGFYKEHLKMYTDLMKLLSSNISWNNQNIPLYELLREGLNMYYFKETYKSMRAFDKINASLFVPYMKSLVFDYWFLDCKRTVENLADFFNEVIIYIKAVLFEVYRKRNNTNDRAVLSTLHRHLTLYFSNIGFNDTYHKLLYGWTTRKPSCPVTFNKTTSVLNTHSDKITKLL